jgi:NDP-sugar pyrophosphorylase family protein
VARARKVTGEVAVNVHHGRRLMEAHLETLSPPVHASFEEPRALGTAGALGRLRPWIDGRDALVVNADAWHGADLAAFAAGWDGRRVRLLTVRDPARATWGDRCYAGVALLPWSGVARLPSTPSGLWEAWWRRLVPGEDLELVLHEGPWFDCGTPASYLAANLESSGGRSVVGTGALVEGEVESSVVWPGARVEAGEQLRRAVRATGGVTVLVR